MRTVRMPRAQPDQEGGEEEEDTGMKPRVNNLTATIKQVSLDWFTLSCQQRLDPGNGLHVPSSM